MYYTRAMYLTHYIEKETPDLFPKVIDKKAFMFNVHSTKCMYIKGGLESKKKILHTHTHNIILVKVTIGYQNIYISTTTTLYSTSNF